MKGLTYKEIADETGIAFGTVKMFFQRLKDQPAVPRCEQCHRTLRQDVTRAGRRFCSDKCRAKWWETHPDKTKSAEQHPIGLQYSAVLLKILHLLHHLPEYLRAILRRISVFH